MTSITQTTATPLTGMSHVSRSELPVWVDTTGPGFTIIDTGEWTDGELIEPMHPFGSNRLHALYAQYDELLSATSVAPEAAHEFAAFRSAYFNDGAVVRTAPQILLSPTSGVAKLGAALAAAVPAGGALGLIAHRIARTRVPGNEAIGIGATVGLVVAYGAGVAGVRLLESTRRSAHEAKIDAFHAEYDRITTNPEIKQVVDLEEQIFATERDWRNEGSADEKAALISAEVVRRLDVDHSGAIEFTDDAVEGFTGRRRGHYVRWSDANGDSQTTAPEIARYLTYTMNGYGLKEDDSYVTGDFDTVPRIGEKWDAADTTPGNASNDWLELITRKD